MSELRDAVLAARARLAEGLRLSKQRHDAGASGEAVCALLGSLWDEILLALFHDATTSLGIDPHDAPTLVVHGGLARNEVSPHSDADLMVLYEPRSAAAAEKIAERLLGDVFDAGLVLGHSLRTPEEACRLGMEEPVVCSSLLESRLLIGNVALYERFRDAFLRRVRRRRGAVLAMLEASRDAERARFGETVYLLEPNVKRSRGGLRDLQWIRWIGAVRYDAPEPDALRDRGRLSDADLALVHRAREFLLRLRNELHFQAGRASDVLSRAEQVRIAEQQGLRPVPGLHPVERFMRDYFRHTEAVSRLAARLSAKARAGRRREPEPTIPDRRLPGGLFLGPTHVVAGKRAVARFRKEPAAVLRAVEAAAAVEKTLSPETWEAIRNAAVELPNDLATSTPAVQAFLDLLEHSARLGVSLRGLHDVGLLERIIPEFEHARGLLQFNQYHKYTVDEHSFRTVEYAARLVHEPGPLGCAYRELPRKRLLHLALLIHDLGKGHLEDHCELGRHIARQTARRLQLDREEREDLEFLVARHLLMNHLAFRRDTSDEYLIVKFAVETGTPELLRMLYILTASDLAAVGPDAWSGWKAEVLTDLYRRTMQHLAGERPDAGREQYREALRRAVRERLGPRGDLPQYVERLASLPPSYLDDSTPEQTADDLELLADLGPEEVRAGTCYQPETRTLRFTVGTREAVAAGIFHRLTGVLTSRGMEILAARINTLDDGIVLDRFHVRDVAFPEGTPVERLAAVRRELCDALRPDAKPPAFARVWQAGGAASPSALLARTQVRVDNASSQRYTILDVFAFDRRGLLYTVARTLYELELSVWRAKIGTFLDQVVDVFYVTDRRGAKIEDAERLRTIRQRLVEVIDRTAAEFLA